MFNLNNITYYLPELIILIGVFFQTIFSFFNFKRISNIFSLATLILSGCIIVFVAINPLELSSYLFKILIIISSLLIFFLKTRRVFTKKLILFNTLYLSSIFFLMMIINSNNFLSLYLNIELFSVTLYFLIAFDRFKKSISETMKYMFSSIIASSFLLFGVAFIYGICGHINFSEIKYHIEHYPNYSFSTYIFPYLFVFCGLLFKLGAFPFANWMIDIFKNVDTKIVAYISVVPKLAIFSVFIKVFSSIVSFEIALLIIFSAIITGLFGVVYGFKSKNIKEIITCSCYINVSYMLIAFALYTRISLSSVIFYWITYSFMNIGAFAGIIALEHSNLANKDFNYCGYFYKNKFFSICFALCILALWGLPLTSGFIAKIYLLTAILNSGLILIPIILFMFIIMVLSTIFYLGIIQNMIAKNNKDIIIHTNKRNKLILYLCTFITLVIGFSPAFLIRICEIISYYS